MFRSLTVLLAIMSHGLAHAAMVELRPASSSLTPNSQVTVDAFFVPDAGTLIGAFDITVRWDASVLALVDSSFDVYLDAPLSVQARDPGTDTIEMAETSLGDLALQSGSVGFRLFSLQFMAIGSGGSSIDLLSVLLSNEQGDPVSASRSGATVQVVPLPMTAWLLLYGIAGLRIVARKLRLAPASASTPL